ncbi:nidogen-2 isoform X8 [Melopsittacus undulatus]|uniref:nidogen-2 isoform X8 n=1 Tax=Melopsittacus undulatus TaxID=13146 RepID=UPI00146EF11C|nr:nidogen-2 isoform X8 [Melopsittacus undulatus]
MRAVAAVLVAALAVGTALPRPGLLPHGPASGDARLQPGDDESSPGVLLRPAPRLYGHSARRLYVGTNGVISTQDFPRETQYVDDDFPTDFPVIAPFLADLDTSGDRGNIYYRQDNSPDVLDQAVGYIQAGFPHTTSSFMPTNAFIATWEDVGAYQELSQDTEPSRKLNTFQAVIAYNDEDTYAIFLYPEGGLRFLGTRPKESYNVQLELPARVGFSWGDGDDPKRDGLFHSLASSEPALRNLERESNTGVPGVWVFHVGSVAPLEHVEPGAAPVSHASGSADYTRTLYSRADHYSHADHYNRADHTSMELLAQHSSDTLYPDRGSHTPVLQGIVPKGLPASLGQEWSHRLHPNGDHSAQQSYSASPSSYSSGHHGVGVEEDVHGNPDVFTYSAASRETCAQHHRHCSPHAFCTDYTTGACCHCQATYYGNGRQCLPEGAVHRLNGKVSGSLTVGQASVRFQDVDLHAYIVGSDGRTYTAISGVPQPAARALLPLLPIGGLFAWLFALEEPGSENGFSITGAEFTQNLEVTFYPGEETVHVTQTAEGLGADNYLSLKTHIQGRVPFLQENTTVHIAPYKELYHYSSSAVTSSAQREYILVAGTANQTMSYFLRQNITFAGCPHTRLLAQQRLSVAHAFTLYDSQEHVLRYALAAHIGSAGDNAENSPVNPCHDSTHTCEATAHCQPGTGMEYTCECAAGYRRDGRGCRDVDECAEGLSQCGPFTICLNGPGSYRCECHSGYRPAEDGQGCVLLAPVSNPCEDGSHPCAPGDRARCLIRAGGQPTCECLPGYTGDGISCSDMDECAKNPCHPAAVCYNTPGSFSCRCQPGYEGDGFQCTHASVGSTQRLTPCQHEQLYPREVPPGPSPVSNGHVPQCDEEGQYRPLQCHSSTGYCWCVDAAGQEIAGTRTAPGSTPPRCGTPESTERPRTMCERWQQSLLEHYGGSPRSDQYVPQCDVEGNFTPLQCHGDSGYCWCVDESGREIQGTRSEPGSTPPCLPSVAPPSVRPSPRTDVSPPATGTFLLYAQGQQIGYLPLNGTRLQKEAAKTLLSLHGSIVVGIDYDCREKTIYWTDVAGRTISRASLEPGAEPETIISSGLISPEGLAVDHLRRAMFWTDSGLDKIERARLDGSERRVLFDTDLVNPRAIAVDPVRGNLYWTDWNREAPKIETSTVNGANRRVLVNKDIGLPNGLTFDPFSKLLCWADAGTKHLECTFPDGTGRRVIQNNLNYPFSIISYANHFYHTDWRRDGVIAVDKETGFFTEEYLPEQRSHLYGITAVYPYCPGARR